MTHRAGRLTVEPTAPPAGAEPEPELDANVVLLASVMWKAVARTLTAPIALGERISRRVAIGCSGASVDAGAHAGTRRASPRSVGRVLNRGAVERRVIAATLA